MLPYLEYLRATHDNADGPEVPSSARPLRDVQRAEPEDGTCER